MLNNAPRFPEPVYPEDPDIDGFSGTYVACELSLLVDGVALMLRNADFDVCADGDRLALHYPIVVNDFEGETVLVGPTHALAEPLEQWFAAHEDEITEWAMKEVL